MTAEVACINPGQRPAEKPREPRWSPAGGVVGTFMGRDALALVASVLDLKTTDRVLLPAYLCGEVVKPFLGRSCVDFYPVPLDLIVDPACLEVKFAEHGALPRVLVIINYFGFLQPHRKQIRKLCTSRGVVLVEDCAHSLLSEGSGDTGDFSIHSFRKTLPVPDGGGLQIQSGGSAVAPCYYPRFYSNALSICATVKSVLKVRSETLSRAGLSAHKPTSSNDGGRSAPRRFLPLSSFSSFGIRKVSCEEIIARRRKDFLFWQQATEPGGRCMPVFTELPPGVCPLGYPVKIKNRDSIRAQLKQEGVFLRTHWRLPTVIGPEFVNSQELSAQLLTLPVHPELSERDREVILRVLLRGTSR